MRAINSYLIDFNERETNNLILNEQKCLDVSFINYNFMSDKPIAWPGLTTASTEGASSFANRCLTCDQQDVQRDHNHFRVNNTLR